MSFPFGRVILIYRQRSATDRTVASASAASAQTDDINLPLDSAAFASVQALVGGDFDARAAAFQSAYGINATFAEVRGFPAELNAPYEVSAQTDYTLRISSPQDLRGTQVPFEFVINGGELRIEDFALWSPGIVPELFGAFVEAEIRILSLGTWRFGAQLTKDFATGDPIVRPAVLGNQDDFGLGVFPALTPFMDGGDAVVTIPEIRGTVWVDGASFRGHGEFFGYEMQARLAMPGGGLAAVPALAGITDPFALGTPGDPGDDLGNAFDPSGGQLFLAGQPLASYPVAVIPVPASAVLMISGIVSFSLLRNRRRPTPGPVNA